MRSGRLHSEDATVSDEASAVWTVLVMVSIVIVNAVERLRLRMLQHQLVRKSIAGDKVGIGAGRKIRREMVDVSFLKA